MQAKNFSIDSRTHVFFIKTEGHSLKDRTMQDSSSLIVTKTKRLGRFGLKENGK